MAIQQDEERNDIPLTAIQPTHPDGDDVQARTLPRADGGKDAWLVLAGCFVLEALVWGYVLDATLHDEVSIDGLDSDIRAASHTPSVYSRTITPPTSHLIAIQLASQPSPRLPAV